MSRAIQYEARAPVQQAEQVQPARITQAQTLDLSEVAQRSPSDGHAVSEEPIPSAQARAERPWRRYAIESLLALGGVGLLTGVIALSHLSSRIPTIALVYLLVIVVLASTCGLYTALLASLLEVVAFDYFLVSPAHTLLVLTLEDLLTLVAFLGTALLTSEVTSVLRKRAEQARRCEQELRLLYEQAQQLAPTIIKEKGSTPGGPAPGLKPPGISVLALLTKVGPRLIMLLVLVASVLMAIAQFTPPSVVPASAPASVFSAERAMSQLRTIAQQPHPMGSQTSADVRAYLIQQIRAMGLTPEVQTTTTIQHWPDHENYWVATVHNVVVRLQGTANTRAILLDAHYDSAATGPGASDNGAAVVTLLETMRALKAGSPLKNDVIFVFADGEERMDVGAHAFATQYPWMQEVGLALNFEAMSTRGATELFDSSPQDGWLISEFLKAAPFPLANSFMVNLFKAFSATQMGMDLQEYLDQGSAGLDFVYTGDLTAYHTMRNNVQVIDPRSIQHDGSYALSLVRHFGSMDLSHTWWDPTIVSKSFTFAR